MAFSNTPIDVAGAVQESLSTSVSVSGVETPAGSVAVLIASTDDGGAPDTWTASISDDTGGGWNIAGYADSANAGPTRSVVAWKQFSTGDTSNTITVGFGAAREWRSLCVAVFSADGVVSQVDYGATNQATLGNGTKDQDINGPSVNANAGDLVVSLIDTYRHCTLTALTGYALQAVDFPSPQTLAGIASRVAASSGSYGTGFHYRSTVSSQHGYALHGLVLHVDAGAAIALTGTISSASQVQGQFALATALTGAIASTSNLAGDLTVAENTPLAGTASSVSGVHGSLGLSTSLDGAISSESTVEGSLQLTVGLQGGLASVSTAQGSLGLAMPLEGAASSVSGLSGSLGVSTALQGTIASVSNLAGDLTVAGDVSLVGTAASVSAVQGRLGLNLLLSSEVRSVSETRGGIGLSTPLSGTISSESALSGALSVAGESALAGAISSISALRGELNLSIGLAGFSRSESSLSSELSIGGELTLNGTISSVSRLSGGLSLGPYIDLQESITLGAYDSVRIYSNGTRLFTV
jgi:hypothetical protein